MIPRSLVLGALFSSVITWGESLELGGANKIPTALFLMPQSELKARGVGKLSGPLGYVDLTALPQKIDFPSTPGSYKFAYHDPQKKEHRINVFVQLPASKVVKGKLNGYRIGTYPKFGPRRQPPPDGFIEVTKENLDWKVSKSYVLGEFLCKQKASFPKFVALKADLLKKLERLLEFAQQRGFSWTKFTIMSGYRTPFYNKQIGNVKLSQHQYGNAADIFVDENPKDGIMDDLNHDKKHDFSDAAELFNLVEALEKSDTQTVPSGGLSAYKANRVHGPFVHVDARGYRARW
ncbi:MAG: D-Ala-D-Ala carboxypeptidase family metallohydrolase [Bdellovibrionota bacterium]